MKPVKMGLIGSGIISWTYLDNMVNRFDSVEVMGCSDLIPERSAARAEEFGIRQTQHPHCHSGKKFFHLTAQRTQRNGAGHIRSSLKILTS